MRVRQFTQDDAHIFCREDQIVEEVRAFCALPTGLQGFRLQNYAIKLALRPEKRFGSEEMWDKAEQSCAMRSPRRAVNTRNMAGRSCPAKAPSMRPSSNGT
jgi:threonyl-tRNA synthetase